MKTILCKTCYFKCHYDRTDYCDMIENEHGGNIKANQTTCQYYLKKGTEPKWLCNVCGQNTYGHSSSSVNKKHYCSDCWWKKEAREYKEKKRIEYRQNIEKVAGILGGDEKKAKQIVDLLK